MMTVTSPDAAEALANGVFEALMWSLSRPGKAGTLPEAGFAPLALTLVDIECTVYTDDMALKPVLIDAGARLTDDIALADHVFLTSLTDQPIEALNCGSALYPDEGATLVLAAAHQGGAGMRLTGPGIDGEAMISVAVPAGFWELRNRLCTYPEGFDVFLVDGKQVLGIPRSSKVEAL